MNDVQFQSFMLGERISELSYVEGRDRSDAGMMVRTAVIHNNAVPEELEEVQSALLELLDRWLTIMRNPPEEISERRTT